MKLLKVAFAFALALPAAYGVAETGTQDQSSVQSVQLTSQDAITASQNFNREVQKLFNVVSNNNRIVHFTDEVQSVKSHGRYLSKALNGAQDGYGTYDIGDSFYELRSEWLHTRTQLRPFAGRYADLALHLAKTQLLFEELNRRINVMLFTE